MSLFEFTESYYKEQLVTRLQDLINRFGLKIRVYRAVQNAHKSVYGTASGDDQASSLGEIDGLIVGDSFFPADFGASGNLDEGYLYTNSDIVRSGDKLEVIRRDKVKFRFKAESLEDVGTTTRVFKKYKISSLGD